MVGIVNALRGHQNCQDFNPDAFDCVGEVFRLPAGFNGQPEKTAGPAQRDYGRVSGRVGMVAGISDVPCIPTFTEIFTGGVTIPGS